MLCLMMHKVIALNNDHKPLILEHYKKLDHDSRICRFGTAVKDITLANFIDKLNLIEDYHFGVLHNHTIIALVQLSRFKTKASLIYDFGISVHKEYQRKGLGSALWERVKTHAAITNVQEIHISHSSANTPMRHFCQDRGLPISYYDGDRIAIWKNPDFQPDENTTTSEDLNITA